ncbi:MAG: carboxypeptidase-like regulatory domain-containing protein, partial [Planctomycetota bacterium]
MLHVEAPTERIERARLRRAKGIVLDAETGEPVSAFRVDSVQRIDVSAAEPSALNPFSGGFDVEHPEGRFDLGPLAPGSVRLEFKAAGYLPARESLTVAEDQSAPGLIVELTRGGRIEGRVVDAEGLPVAGARVVRLDGRGRVVGRPKFRGQGLPGGRMIDDFLKVSPLDIGAGAGLFGDAGASSDREGRFALAGLELGEHTLVATHRDHAPTLVEGVTVEAEAVPEPLEIVLASGATLTGVVEDLRDRPVADALVMAASPSDGDPGASGGLYQARTDAQGRYRIERMSAGSYFVVNMRPDAELNPVALIGGASYELVSIPREGTVELDLLDRSIGGTRVFGRVLDGGEPVSTGALFAADFDAENLLGVDFKLARVAADGSYEFPGLAPGSYRWTYQGGEGEVLFEVEVPDRPEFRHDVELPGASVAGRVLSGVDGDGVHYAEVVLTREDGSVVGDGLLAAVIGQRSNQRRDWTAGDGSFRFRALEAGRYRLTVNGPQ